MIKTWKLKVIVSDTDNNKTDSVEDYANEWIDDTENENVLEEINFPVTPKISGPHVSPSIVELQQFFKLFFTNKLVNEIINETNNFAKTWNKITTRKINQVPRIDYEHFLTWRG